MERHWHIAYGIAGYGPDGADGFTCALSANDAAECARDYLREYVWECDVAGCEHCEDDHDA